MKRLLGVLLVCLVVACQSDQEIHLDKINDLQLQLVDAELKTNLEIAQKLVVEMENYVSKYPDSTTIPYYYMQLGDLYTHALQLPVKGLYFFQKVNADFPNYEKAAVALFHQGFLLENYMGQQEQAKAVYESFLVAYPQHELSETVKLSIQQLGIPLEELVKQFEKKN
tara:strand:- start:938 stop:1441 length:504 start_codon:yes stop_codon:yes gene_type:complete